MLHNTTSVCKQNYLDPKLIQFYESKSEDFIQYFNGYQIVFNADNFKSDCEIISERIPKE